LSFHVLLRSFNNTFFYFSAIISYRTLLNLKNLSYFQMVKANTNELDTQVENADILARKEGELEADSLNGPIQHIHGKTIILLLVSTWYRFSIHHYEY
jgi:hypothetical protein